MTGPMHPEDFRERLERELAERPDGAGPAEDLAAGKQLLRRRRTTWGAALATVAVAAGVPLTLALSGDSPGPSGPSAPPTTSSPEPAPDADWRWESYRGATFRVPASWGYAGDADWCLNPEAAVRRPARVARAIGCGDGIGYGVQFYVEATYDSVLNPGQVVGVDSERSGWSGYEVVENTVVHVFTRSEDMTRRILESVQPIDGVDANGCAPVAELDHGIGEDPVLPTLESVEAISVCRYDVAVGGRLEELLVQSERLTGAAAEKALTALRAAEVSSEQRATCPKVIDTEAVLLRLDGHEIWVNWGSDCREIGVLDGREHRQLTAEVMHWALSPGWTGEFPVEHVPDHALFTPRTLDGSGSDDPTFEEVVWEDVRFEVPPKWDRAGATDWCLQAEHPEDGVPRVSLPGMGVRDILCHPDYGYGVSVGSGAAISFAHPSGHVWQYGDEGFYPEGAWLSIVYDEEWAVTIRTPDKQLTQLIAESVRFGS